MHECFRTVLHGRFGVRRQKVSLTDRDVGKTIAKVRVGMCTVYIMIIYHSCYGTLIIATTNLARRESTLRLEMMLDPHANEACVVSTLVTL